MSALQLVFVVFVIAAYSFVQAFLMMLQHQRKTYAEALAESWFVIVVSGVLVLICLGIIAVYRWLGEVNP